MPAGRRTGLLLAADAEQGVRRAGGLLVVCALILGALEGGYAPSKWAPATILVLWVAVIGAFALRRTRPGRPATIALAAYGLLTLWTFASITWADTPGRALDTGGRTALYGLALVIVVLPRWPRASLERLLGLVGAGTVVLALGTLVAVDLKSDPSSSFIDGRLVAPMGYVNATAGLWLIAIVPLLSFAAGGTRRAWVRALSLGGAAFLLQMLLLSQSRGSLLAVGVAIAVLLVATPRRGATLLAVAAVLVATVPVAPALLHVRGAPTVAGLADRLGDANLQIAVSVVLLVVAGLVWQEVLRRLPDGPRDAIAAARTGDVATVVVVVLLAVGGVAKVGNPVTWVGDRVDTALFAGYDGVPTEGARLTSLGTNRGDFYRVALRAFRSSPLVGVGAEDYQVSNLKWRRSAESPRYAHSVELGILAGLGIVGALLALAAFGTLVGMALLRLRRLELASRVAVAAALAGFAGWLAEASWDWTWEFPAVTLVGVVLLGAAARATDVAGTAPSPELRAIRERARAHGVAVPSEFHGAPLVPRSADERGIAGVLLVVLVAGSLGLGALGLASWFQQRGTTAARTDPTAAARDLSRASNLNPLDSDALLSRAVVVRRAGDAEASRRDLVEVVRRSPNDWFARLELGMLDALAGRRDDALRELARAQALNPRQRVIGQVLGLVRAGKQPDPTAVEVTISRGIDSLLLPTRP